MLVEKLGLQVGDAPVEETGVGASGLEPLVECLVDLVELSDALLERGVLVELVLLTVEQLASKPAKS